MPANRQGNGSFFNYSGLIDSTSQRTTAAQNDAPVRTVEQTQATPPASPNDDAAKTATSPGAGAGTGQQGGDDNPGPSTNTQQIIAQSVGNSNIVSQPNVLDQYASYTYAISWFLLTPAQFTAITTGGSATSFNTGTWKLLMQSGGAPTQGRDQYFPVDHYLDDLEVNTFLMGKGTNMSSNAMDLKFKVVEPNGITLMQNLYQAVVSTYASTGQTSKQPPNYVKAQYCLMIEFYGYDAQGNLVAPATGQYSPTGQLSNTNPRSIVQKYFPFVIQNITFRTAQQTIEYFVTGSPVPYVTASSQARGTIPFPFSLSGQTVQQILQGAPHFAGTSTVDPGSRTSTAIPAQTAPTPQPDDAQTAALFNDGTGYTPGYDPNAGWSA